MTASIGARGNKGRHFLPVSCSSYVRSTWSKNKVFPNGSPDYAYSARRGLCDDQLYAKIRDILVRLMGVERMNGLRQLTRWISDDRSDVKRFE